MTLTRRFRSITHVVAFAAFAACNRYEYRELCPPPAPTPAGSIAWEQADLPAGTISGRIVGIQTGAQVAGSVSLEPTGRHWMANDGVFRVDSLSPGQYTLRVRFIGYMGASQQITLDDRTGVSVLAVLARHNIMLDGCGAEKVRKPWWRFE